MKDINAINKQIYWLCEERYNLLCMHKQTPDFDSSINLKINASNLMIVTGFSLEEVNIIYDVHTCDEIVRRGEDYEI